MIFLVVVISIPTILFFVLNSGWVQTKLAHHVNAIISENWGNRISVRDIRVSWFNRAILHDLLVTDVHGDTILAVPELIARINLRAISTRNIDLNKVTLNRADIRFAMDTEIDAINIKFIVDRLKSKDTTDNKPKWIFGIRSIELNDCRFSFKNPTKPFDRPFGIDYADLDVSNLNFTASDFHPVGDSMGGVVFRIQKLSCIEKCGLDMKLLSADFAVNKNNLSFKNLHIVSSGSEIEAKDASFRFGSFQDFSDGNFTSKVLMDLDISMADVAFCDLSHFVPYFVNYAGHATVSGKVTGVVENLKGDKIDIHFGNKTRIYGNYDLKGLPNIRTTLIYADFSELSTNPQDIELIHLPRSSTGHVNLSEAMHRITNIRYKGNFTGFFDDFVAYGVFTTNLGKLSTDIAIRPMMSSETDTTFTFRGSLKTERFHLGKLLTQPAIGEITMSGMVEGLASGKGNVFAQLEGQIASIDLKGYEYRHVAINGAVNDRTYDGQLSIDEPNIKMDFSGKVDLTETIPAFDFFANVERARLYDLKLVEKDTSSFVAFSIKAEFSGNNIDNLSGELELRNSLFRRNSREIEINNLLLFSKAIRDTNSFILRSDILDARIRGQYQFMKLPESFFSLMKNFAPAWIPASFNPDSLSNNSFRFDLQFKETKALTNFFMNEFNVARGTTIEGIYNPAHRDFNFLLYAPSMTLDGKQWEGFYANGSVENSAYVVESGCAAFRINKNISFEHLSFFAKARGDSIGLDITWNNWDSVLNKGSLKSKIFFLKKPKQTIPMIYIFSSPGQIVTSGDAWMLTHQGIAIDTASVKIDGLRASKGGQEILVSGVVSHREQDKLEVTVKNLDLSVINSSTQFNKLMFGGIANGTASLSNLYMLPVFDSDIHVDDFSLNDRLFGSTDLNASWNSVNRSVGIKVLSMLNGLSTLHIAGNYFISDRALDFDVSVANAPINILKPYLNNIFTDMEGTLSSKLKLTGIISNPFLNGSIDMQNTALTLDYTKTRYHFSGVTTVSANKILFKNIDLFDRYDNLCKITDGFIFFERLKDISYNLQFQANNLEVLNTGVHDNNLFWGKAFATGKLGIRGTPKEMLLDITVRSERNTRFNIPLTSSDEITQTGFITFVDHTPRTQRRSLEFLRRSSAAVSNKQVPDLKFDVKINLDLTPDAEAWLIFDATIGDIIKARGKGDLMLNIANNRFDMTGTYTIEEGDYLFTLRNVLNKPFTIEKGGVISWNGVPTEALLNLRAIYKARPMLSDLMNDESLKRSVPVECILNIGNTLTNPTVKYDLNIPNAEQDIRSFLSEATKSEEEMARQIIFLLMANRFYVDPNQMTNSGASGTGLETMGLAAATEFLTSQLSYMISQWGDFNFGLQASPGTVGFDYARDQWNFHYNYNYRYEGSMENSDNNFGGEFIFEWRPKKSNKFRFKVFNRANAVYLSQNPYTQGVGVLYREEFNQWSDLFKRKNPPANRREDEDE